MVIISRIVIKGQPPGLCVVEKLSDLALLLIGKYCGMEKMDELMKKHVSFKVDTTFNIFYPGCATATPRISIH